jgi:hypothetical protein
LLWIETMIHRCQRSEAWPSGFGRGFGFDFEDLKGAEKRRGEWRRAAACLSGESQANAASSADPTRTEHRRERERSSGDLAGKKFLVTFVATKAPRTSWRSQRRNAFEVEVKIEAGPESNSDPGKPTTKSRGTIQ